jgi:hypothetical protein
MGHYGGPVVPHLRAALSLSASKCGVARVCMFTAVIAYPVWWLVRSNLHQWYAMPFNGVVKLIMLPILFLRQLPPMVNVVGLIVLPPLYSYVIKWIYFFN